MNEILIITMVWGIIQAVLKNPAKKLALRSLLLHVRDSINMLYPDSVAYLDKGAVAGTAPRPDHDDFLEAQLDALSKLKAA